MEGPEAYTFHRAVGVLRLGDGAVVVADGGAGNLRWYDRTGNHLSTAGRVGDGPGEFRGLSWIGRVGSDSVYAWDRQARRISVFVAGQLIRSASLLLRGEGDLPLAQGVMRDGTMLLTPGPVYIPQQSPGLQRPLKPLWIVPPAADRIESLGPFPGSFVNLQSGGAPGVWFRTEIPFGSTTLIAAGEGIIVGDNSTYEIRIYTASGDLQQLIRRTDVIPRPVGQKDLDAELGQRLASAPQVKQIRDGIRADFLETPAPETMPYYRALLVDRARNLWVRRDFPADEVPMWDVFDPEGRWLGGIAMPVGLEVTEIGEDYILGIWKDDLDVAYVRMYGLIQP